MAKGAYIGVGGVARKIKKGYIGVASRKVKLTNLAPAMSSLSFGLNGGSAVCEMSTAHTKYGSSALCITGAANDNEEYGVTTQKFQLIPDHFYYACVEVYQEAKLGSVDFFWPAASPSMFGGQATGNAGTWEKCSNITTRSSFAAGEYPIRLDFNNGGTAGKMWFDGLMLIDLTEAFGAGNEPGNAWCQENIPYFTGTTTVERATEYGVARKIKKAYIGIGGVARPCWGGGLEYYGTITPLSVARLSLAATTVGNYALFGGGRSAILGTIYATVDAYNQSLTRTTPTALSEARVCLAATTVGDYALFGGGSYSVVVDAYDQSLTRTTLTALSEKRYSLAATTVGDYALFGGDDSAVVDAYDQSLTRTTPTALSEARVDLKATTVGNYALFGGGYTSAVVDAYDQSLTRTTPTALSEARGFLAATTVGNYALFGGGYGENNEGLVYYNTVDAYTAA